MVVIDRFPRGIGVFFVIFISSVNFLRNLITMKNIIIAGLLTGLACTLTAVPAMAQNQNLDLHWQSGDETEQLISQWGWGNKRGGQGQWMQSLNLTDSQKQQLEAIRQKYQGQMQSLSEQLRTSQNELRTLMAGNGSDSQIRAKHSQVANLRQQLGELRFNSMLESRQVLTPEQRQKFSELMQERRNNRQGRRGVGSQQ
ncbi:Spy/CpxP family protein refolding chaperone [Synechocystis salina LEGE 06099]|nr:Spy/CpxP family protein refolding chaperone [Synechocystis salina LEGE 06099]